MEKIVALIPSYNASQSLGFSVRNHVADFTAVVIINDGSAKECEPIFCELERIENLTLLRHGVTPGKGAALKTGFNHILCYFNDVIGAVTMDADGQHLTQDTRKSATLPKKKDATDAR